MMDSWKQGYHGHNVAERILYVTLWSVDPAACTCGAVESPQVRFPMTRGAALHWAWVLLTGKGFLFLISVPLLQLLCSQNYRANFKKLPLEVTLLTSIQGDHTEHMCQWVTFMVGSLAWEQVICEKILMLKILMFNFNVLIPSLMLVQIINMVFLLQEVI